MRQSRKRVDPVHGIRSRGGSYSESRELDIFRKIYSFREFRRFWIGH